MLIFMDMKKVLLTFIISVFAFCSYAQHIPKWKITDVEKYMKDSSGVLVINFWATFCKPCVAEIPSFIKITDQYKTAGVHLTLVSLDLPDYFPKKVAAFAKTHHFTADILWLDETNADYFCPKMDPK